MGLTVTEDTPADMLAGNMELLVQLPPRADDDYDSDEVFDEDENGHRHQLHHRNHHRHHNHHHSNGHHPRRAVNGNARKVIVARSTPMMDLLVQVATSQKLSASSYTLEAIGEHGLVLTHHPNTPIGALDALQVKLLPKQGTFAPMKTRQANQPFEPTFRLQVHLPRNQLYVSRVSARMNLGKILDEVCREKNLDRNNYELRHPANIEETLDLTLSLQDYHLQEVTLCPKRRQLGSSLSSQDIMALQRQEERRRQEAKQSVFGFTFKKSKESSLSTDSLGERSVSPAHSDGTGRSASPQAPTAPTRPQRKRRPAPKPPVVLVEEKKNDRETTIRENERTERTNVISHSRNSSDSSGYHEASVLSDNLDSNIRVPDTLPRRSRLQPTSTDSPGRTLAESSQASKSLGNLAVVTNSRSATIARGNSNSSLVSTGLRKKKAAPAPPPPRPLSSAISTQALERIIDSEESLPPETEASQLRKDVEAKVERRLSEKSEKPVTSNKDVVPVPEVSEFPEKLTSAPNVEPAFERKRVVAVPVPRPRNAVEKLVSSNAIEFLEPAAPHLHHYQPSPSPSPLLRDLSQSLKNLEQPEDASGHSGSEKNIEVLLPPSRPLRRNKNKNMNNTVEDDSKRVVSMVTEPEIHSDKPVRKAFDDDDDDDGDKKTAKAFQDNEEYKFEHVTEVEERNRAQEPDKFLANGVKKVANVFVKVEETTTVRDEVLAEELGRCASLAERFEEEVVAKTKGKKVPEDKRRPDKTKDLAAFHALAPKLSLESSELGTGVFTVPTAEGKRSCAIISTIPKCDNFLSHQTDDEDLEKSPDLESPKYNVAVRLDSGLGASFGAGKSILDGDYRRNENDAVAATMIPPSNGAEFAEDELELESFEMFETPKTDRKHTKFRRSHSELNNFEINAFGGADGRYLTSRSVDFTFAINPNLADVNLGEKDKGYYTIKDVTAPGKNPRNLLPDSIKLPPFLTSQITWERPEDFLGVGVDAKGVGPTFGEPGSDDSGSSLASVVPVPNAAVASESTSDLLKKVSDTLSGSLRSPEVANGIPSSVANERSGSESSSLCVDLQSLPPGDGDTRIGANGARPPVSGAIEELRKTEMSTEITEKRHELAMPSTDWEYQLPEPPTAFRDAEEAGGEKNEKIEKFNAASDSEETKRKLPEIVAVTPSTPKVAPGAEEGNASSGIEEKNGGSIRGETLVSKTRNKVVKKEEEEAAVDFARLPRAGVKTGVDSGSRRTSYASSTPSVAPSDNTLSNFMITTYSRPKNVDIFGEIERAESEPRSVVQGRKNSPAFGAFNLGSRKNSSETIKDSQPAVVEEKISSVDIAFVQRIPEEDLPRKESEPVETVAISRSNIKISIATKPRPRAETISSDTLQRPKPAVRIPAPVEPNTEDEKPVEDGLATHEAVAPSNNQRFSQWRENILKKQETQTVERQLQSLQVLRSILPQSEDPERDSDATGGTDETDRAPPVETREASAAPSVEVPVSEATIEPRIKRYTYAGPPAIDLGSWSDRSRSRVQIKPDTDYKFEKNQAPEAKVHEQVMNAYSSKPTLAKPEKTASVENREPRREPNEITKTSIARTTAAGFKRPASIAVVENISTLVPTVERKDETKLKEEEIDTRPINFKELKEAFGKDHKANSSALQFIPKYGSLARRSETLAGRFAVRRDSTASSNGDSEIPGTLNKAENSVEKRNFVIPSNRGIGLGFQQQENLRKTSRGMPMPVVKGFKLPAPEDETQIHQEKRPSFRVAIGDISNGNHAPNYARKNHTVQVNAGTIPRNSTGIPKPPPTMPVITGVTLKSTSANSRPKSAVVELDPRNQLLESIRGFGGANQLRKVPRRN